MDVLFSLWLVLSGLHIQAHSITGRSVAYWLNICIFESPTNLYFNLVCQTLLFVLYNTLISKPFCLYIRDKQAT